MKRAAYIHKFCRGAYLGCLRVKQGFDRADAIAAILQRAYGPNGWEYEVSEQRTRPPQRRRFKRRLFACD